MTGSRTTGSRTTEDRPGRAPREPTGRPDAWARQRSLTWVTLGWAFVSTVVGTSILVRARSSWWWGFGLQHLGWGLADAGVVAVVEGVQRARRQRMSDPYAAPVLLRERRLLHRALTVNAVADAGYCLLGAALWRRRPRGTRAAGAGAAILLQGAFLLVHDGAHAVGSRDEPGVAPAA